MGDRNLQLDCLRDPRLAGHATASLPAWLWRADASRVPWSNAVAAAIFGASSPAVLAHRRFDAGQPTAAQIAHLAERLPLDGAAQVQRLRGLGAGLGRTLACSCAQITLADGSPAVLIAAIEPAGPDLPLAERVRRLLVGHEAPLAAFTPAGRLLQATPAATQRLGGTTSLAELGPLAPGALWSLGSDASAVLLLDLDAAAQGLPAAAESAAPAPEPPAPEPEPMAAVEVLPAPEPLPEQPLEPMPAAPVAPEAEPAPADEPTTVAPFPIEHPALPAEEAGRRHPLRFVWQMDAASAFTLTSEEFVALTGAPTAAVLGRPWDEVAGALGMDAEGEVARAVATQDTWSGIVIAWPVEGSQERLPVELSGLPVMDRNRGFHGYRGFGVCRDLAQIARLTQLRRIAALAAEAAQAEPDLPAVAQPVATDERPVLTLVPGAARNVVPFRPSIAGGDRAPTLSPVERKAFRELARQLSARLKSAPPEGVGPSEPDDFDTLQPGVPIAPRPAERDDRPADVFATEPERPPTPRPILDHLPIGVLVHRREQLLYANRAFLDWAHYADLADLTEAGGLNALVLEPGDGGPDTNGGRILTISSENGAPVQARLFSVEWDGEPSSALILEHAVQSERQETLERALRLADGDVRELKSILDTATDGVLVLDRSGRILSVNRSAEALFGYDSEELAGRPFAVLFAPESERTAGDYFDAIAKNGVATVLNDGREVIGRARPGGLIPLFMTVGRIGDEKLCAVFRDITPWKRTEEELINARRQAERASSAKSDFLAKISHEIRTPLNAIIGFSEVMMEERFGPVGNERYREYLKDIHASGGHLVSLINDLLDLSKIEAGKLELTFASVNLNDLTQQCVAIMQPQANRERIIIRSSLAPSLPQIVADARSVRQIVLNLLSNSIKFTGPGGQVIVSTALTDEGEVILRVRDTGVGMSEQEIAAALEPFRQLATSGRWGSGGTGLGLPLTKALAEANRAAFVIRSALNAGTLVEVTFPGTRVLAE